MSPQQEYIKKMVEWGKAIAEWQLRNPTKDWLTELLSEMERHPVWADIKDFEGFYQVSNYGVMRSLDRTVVHSNGRLQFVKGSVMKQTYDKDGYLKVTLNKNGAKAYKRVHQIVAQTFIPNPENKPLPNHLNGVKDDNRVTNLRWATYSENLIHAYRKLGRSAPPTAFQKGVRSNKSTEFKKGMTPSNKGKKYCKETNSYI